MKKIFISLCFFMMAFLPVLAQNSHWEYRNFNALSAVIVVHSNGIAYLFQTDGYHLSVSELDPIYMIPINPGNVFQNNIPDVVLQGAYEDFSGDIVIYGSLNDHPAAVLYDVNNQQLTNVFYDANHPYDCFINGCCGYDINGQMVNMLVLENHGFLVGLDWNNVIDTFMVLNNVGHISDVLWDPYAACFAATGYSFNIAGPQLFLVGVNFDINTGFILNPINSIAWYLQNPAYSYAEYSTSMEILPTGDIVVGQSVRDGQSDWIWLTSINGYSGINNSAVFRMPFYKTWVLDMKYKDDIGQLVILGKINHSCGNIHYLAQVDPYSLTGMNAVQVIGNMPYTTCLYSQNLLTNDIVLQKLETNPISCLRVLATGTYSNFEAYIIETFDITNSGCDSSLKIPDIYVTPNVGNEVFSHTGLTQFPTVTNIPPNNPLYLTEVWSCPDPMPCTKHNTQKSMLLSTTCSNVDYKGDNLMEFIGFTGEITYKVYNLMGQCVAIGNAINGTKNVHLPSNSLYIIKAEDKYGHSATTKFIQVSK